MVNQPIVDKEKQRQEVYDVCTSYLIFLYVQETMEPLCWLIARFEIRIWDYNWLQFAISIFLLTIALADDALFNIKLVEDLTEFNLHKLGLAQILL